MGLGHVWTEYLDKHNCHVLVWVGAVPVAGLQLGEGVEGVKAALGQQGGHDLHQQHRLLKVCIYAVAPQAYDLHPTMND